MLSKIDVHAGILKNIIIHPFLESVKSVLIIVVASIEGLQLRHKLFSGVQLRRNPISMQHKVRYCMF